MTDRGMGHIDDVPDDRDAGFPISDVIKDTVVIPVSLDYSKFVDHVRDQRNTNSCVGFATTRAMHIRSQIQGNTSSMHGSPLYAYSIGRANEFLNVEPLADVGAQPRQVIKAVRELGLVKEETWPFDVSKVNQQPGWVALEEGVDHVLASYHWIFEEGEAKFDAIKRAIAAGYAVAFAVDVDVAFTQWNETGSKAVADLDPSAKILGSHYICAVGYREDAILIVNSWSSTWGGMGYAWLSKERIMNPTTRAVCAIETAPVLW